jgi:YVTN family beta-propeller protein
MKAKSLVVLFVFLILGALLFSNVRAIEVTGTIGVQQDPYGMAYDTAMNEIFVVNTNAGTVSVISDSNNTVVATIPLGNPVPIGVAYWIVYDSGKGELFVSLSFAGNGKVIIISDKSNTVVGETTVGGEPEGVAYDSAKGEIFVANALSNVVSVISDKTDTVTASVTVPYGTSALAYDFGRGEIFATDIPPNNMSNPNAFSSTVSIISDNSNQVVANVTVGSSPQGLTYDPMKNEVFVTNIGSRTVSVISDKNNQVVKTIPLVEYPYAAAYDPSAREILVLCSNGTGLVDPYSVFGSVFVISDNSNTAISGVKLGGSGSSGSSIVYDSVKDEAFVANSFLGTVSVISDISGSSASASPTVPEISALTPISMMAIAGIIAVTFVRLKSASKHKHV